MSGVIQQAVELTKRPIKIVYAKETQNDSLPAGAIDLNDIIKTEGEFASK